MNDGIEFFFWAERETVKDGLSESTTRWLLARLGEVNTSHAAMVMASVCILSVANDDARVQKCTSDCPQHSRDLSGRE